MFQSVAPVVRHIFGKLCGILDGKDDIRAVQGQKNQLLQSGTSGQMYVLCVLLLTSISEDPEHLTLAALSIAIPSNRYISCVTGRFPTKDQLIAS